MTDGARHAAADGAPRQGGATDGMRDAAAVGERDAAAGGAVRDAAAGGALISLDDVSFAYADGDDAPLALAGVTASVAAGECLGIVGHTGSGKSTLLQLMNALLVPTAGTVTVCGMDTAERGLRRSIRERVGLVMQYPESQLFASTVADDLAFGPRNLGLADAEVAKRSREAMARVGLDFDELADRSPFSLSGGQQRRVALAGVLAMRPLVLVLDEPTAGVDPQTAAEISELLRRLKDGGLAVVLVSHSMDDIACLADEVVVLEGGRVLLSGAPAEVFSFGHAAELRRVNLGMPRAAAFCMMLVERGITLEGPILTESQLVDALVDRLG